jgi:hypothetical protein
MTKGYILLERDELQGMVDSAIEFDMDHAPDESPRIELIKPDENGRNWRVYQAALDSLPEDVRAAVEIWREQYLLRLSRDLEHRGIFLRVHAVLHRDGDAWRYAGTWTRYGAPEGAMTRGTPTAFDDPDDALQAAANQACQEIDDFLSLRGRLCETPPSGLSGA